MGPGAGVGVGVGGRVRTRMQGGFELRESMEKEKGRGVSSRDRVSLSLEVHRSVFASLKL